MSLAALGKLLMGVGVGIVLLGALLWGMDRFSLSWPRLPGDIVIERPNFRLYLPLGTSLLLSLILSGLLYWLGRLRG